MVKKKKKPKSNLLKGIKENLNKWREKKSVFNSTGGDRSNPKQLSVCLVYNALVCVCFAGEEGGWSG